MDAANPAAYGDTWYAATIVDAPPRPPLGAEVDAEVCVIGGGLAGLTAARELASTGWSVVLVEAGRIAAHASGRNTGFVLPGFAASPDSIIARVGFDHAKELWTLAQSGLDYVRNVIRHERALPHWWAISAARSRAGRPTASGRCSAAIAIFMRSTIRGRSAFIP
jgi:glycine/D-amino acid oxidase-like deaminating enzyme